jgi:hypothetical protein
MKKLPIWPKQTWAPFFYNPGKQIKKKKNPFLKVGLELIIGGRE